jgi:hypothetical protein
MKFFVAAVLGLIAVSTQTRADSVEGRVQAVLPMEPAQQRQSTYSDAGNGEVGTTTAVPTPTQKMHSANKQSAAALSAEPLRLASITLADRASWFTLYDAGRTLRRDRDGDGHHSEFQIRFDADVLSGDALVYAKLYLRRVGDTGSWRHYYTTQDFWIFGQSNTDDYFVTTTLDVGYPTGRYDVLVDLYEVGYSGIVATLTAYDDASLADLPLEERGLDIPIGLPGYSIGAATTTLLTDDDHDGYYSRYRVVFDADSDVGSNFVFAELWLRPQGGEWIREHQSEDFLVDVSGSADTYSFTGELVSGYATARYDVQIDLFDAATGLLVASIGSERPELSRVPLEDQGRDRYVNQPSNPPSHGDSHSREHGGGGVTLGWMAMLLSLLLIHRKRAAIRRVAPAIARVLRLYSASR